MTNLTLVGLAVSPRSPQARPAPAAEDRLDVTFTPSPDRLVQKVVNVRGPGRGRREA
jgi:hypothetical protein